MGFGNKKKEEEKSKDLTMQEAIVELGKTMNTINTRLDKMEQQPEPQPQPPVTPAATTPEVKPKVKVEEKFIVYDQPTQHQRVIIDQTDKDNPIVYDIETALAKLLNEVATLKKALA